MKKTYTLILFGIVFFALSVVIGYYIYGLIPSNQEELVEIALEKIDNNIDEKTNSLKVENELMASTVEEKKVSPNASIVIKKYYKGCMHTTKEYAEIPQELVNLNEGQVAQYYKDWDLKGFSNNEIVLYKEVEGSCREHYVLRAINEKVYVYNVNDDGTETLKEETEIWVQYLPEDDVKKLEEGIRIFGRDELNAIMEDFK